MIAYGRTAAIDGLSILEAESFVSPSLKALYGQSFVGPVLQDCPAYKIVHRLEDKIAQLQDEASLSLD